MNCKLSKILFRAILCSVATLPGTVRMANAQSTNVDWKYYGGTQSEACFFEAQGVVRKGDHVRVWIKCLRQSDLDGIDVTKDVNGKILEGTAQKVAKYYNPPILLAQNLDADQKLAITTYEVTANLAGFQPQASIFYELSCAERMMRELSISITSGGKSGFKNKPSDWQYAPPEGNGARLLKILCRVR
jgi:hypothetical protein